MAAIGEKEPAPPALQPWGGPDPVSDFSECTKVSWASGGGIEMLVSFLLSQLGSNSYKDRPYSQACSVETGRTKTKAFRGAKSFLRTHPVLTGYPHTALHIFGTAQRGF